VHALSNLSGPDWNSPTIIVGIEKSGSKLPSAALRPDPGKARARPSSQHALHLGVRSPAPPPLLKGGHFLAIRRLSAGDVLDVQFIIVFTPQKTPTADDSGRPCVA